MSTFEARRAGAEEGDPETRLDRLSLYNFRNFEELECRFPAVGVAIVGPNGSGKTNLLEAIYYLQIFRSFRGVRDAELVRFGEDVFRVEARVGSRRGERGLAAAYQRSTRRKKVEVDGREAGRLTEAIGALGAVVFRPDDVEIVRGPPGERRRFLDILLSLVAPGYVRALQRYRAVLGQRNEALRAGADAALLEAWAEGLVECGARIMAARARWVAERSAAFGDYHAAISGSLRASMVYEPSVARRGPDGAAAADPEEAPAGSRGDPEEAPAGSRGDPGEGPAEGSGEALEEGSSAGGAEEGKGLWEGSSAEGAGEEEGRWKERFRRALRASAERERRRGVTVVGPHRDDLAFRAPVADDAERDLRAYGSSGQQRTAALALRLVETDTLHDRMGREPLYLMDDVFAELDEERSGRLLALLDEGRSGQVILTVPKEGEVGLRGGGLARWRIRQGRLWQ